LADNSGRFIHIRGHPSAVGRAQDRESSLVKDRRSTTMHAPNQFRHIVTVRVDVGPIFLTRLNQTHKWSDPTRPNPKLT